MISMEEKFVITVGGEQFHLTHKVKRISTRSVFQHWGRATSIEDRPIYCMIPKKKHEIWRGNHLLTLRPVRTLKLWQNFSSPSPRPKKRYYRMAKVERPDHIQTGGKSKLQPFLDALKVHGYDGWYGPLNYSNDIMEYCINKPTENLFLCDIVTLPPKKLPNQELFGFSIEKYV